MSFRLLNAFQLALACLAGAAALFVGLQTAERRAAREDAEQSVAAAASAIAERLNAAVDTVARDVAIVAGTDLSTSGSRAQFSLEQWRRARPAFESISVASANGRVRASTTARLLGQDVAGESWFNRGRDGTVLVEASGGQANGVSILASPLRDSDGRLEAVVAIQLGERWFARAEAELGRSLSALGLAPYVVIRGGSGSTLYRTAGAAPDSSDLPYVEASARAQGVGESSGWVVSVRSPYATAGRWVAAPSLLGLALLVAAGVAILGWWLGGKLDRFLADAASDEPTEAEVAAVPVPSARLLLSAVATLRHARAQAARGARDARAALGRIQDRLRAFETMSGWTYWSIDLARGEATWCYRGEQSGAELVDRTLPLETLTRYILPEDQALLDMTLEAATEKNGAHDVELRLSGPEREGKRLFVRVERVVESDGRVARLHALSREVASLQVRGGGLGLAAPVAAIERRQNAMLRPVIDSIIGDFNNVLTLVMTNLDLLRGTGANADLVERAMRASERGAGLTGRMIDFARRNIPSLHSTSLGATLEALRPFLAASLPRETRLTLNIPGTLPPIRCDERQLELALMNLIVYAQEVGPPGARVRLVGRTLADAGDQQTVEIAVTAERPLHLDEADQAVRQPSQQARTGLDAVRTLAAQLDGRFETGIVDGREALSLVLPAGEATPARILPPAGPVASARVLLVDSDGLMRSTLAEALLSLGHLVTAAHSGADALRRLEEGPFDVMLAEHGLPFMSGLQLAAIASRSHPRLRIVLMAARTQLPRSAEDFARLDKPFGRAELAHVIARETDEADAARAA